MPLDPELAPHFARMPRINPANPIVRAVLAALVRVSPLTRAGGATVRTVRTGRFKARLHLPDNAGGNSPRGALLWIHGGGYLMGHPRQDDPLCSEVAATLGLVVLAPRYRLSPRHKFPAALDDCREAWDWLMAQASSLGIDRTRVAIGGDSAGGGLAACLVQSLADEDPALVAAQWLFEPMLDDRTGSDGRNDDPPEYFWRSADNRLGWGAYLGMAPGSPDVPPYAVAARYGNVAALPQTWIGIGSEDLFLDESRAYAERLKQAGCAVEFDCVPGAPHGFVGLAPKTGPSLRLKKAALDWLGRAIGR